MYRGDLLAMRGLVVPYNFSVYYPGEDSTKQLIGGERLPVLTELGNII